MPPAVVETVTSLALAIDAKDHYTQGHSQKVSAYAVMIAQALGLNGAEVEEIRLAGLLHDIGKVGIPEVILNKSGPLDATEWDDDEDAHRAGREDTGAAGGDEAHPGDGADTITNFTMARDILTRLAAEQIPLGARVIAIADAYDTITSERTYKKPRTPGRGVCGAGALRRESIRSEDCARVYRDDAAGAATAHRGGGGGLGR